MQPVHDTLVPVIASLEKISKFSVVVMDADGITWTGASHEHSLTAPITFVYGLKASIYLLENGVDRDTEITKRDQPNSGSCEMHWKSIAGDGGCAWTSNVTAFVMDQRFGHDDPGHMLMHA